MARPIEQIFADLLREDFIPAPRIAPARPNNTQDFATYLLTHSFGQQKVSQERITEREGAQSEEPGVLSKIFGFLGSGVRPTTGLVKGALEGEGFGGKLHDAAEGALAGLGSILPAAADVAELGIPFQPNISEVGPLDDLKENADKKAPVSFSQILDENLGVNNKFAKYGGGFVLDVLGDPLTYATLGTSAVGKVGAAKRAEELAAKGFRNTEQVAKDAARAERLSQFNPELIEQPAPAPQFRMPTVGEAAVGRNSIPVAGREPARPFPQVRPQAEFDPEEIAERILANPDDHMEMLKARRSDNARRAADVRWGRDPDEMAALRDAPEVDASYGAAIADRLRQGKLAKQGKVSDGKGTVSAQAANKVIEDIQTGNLPRFKAVPEAQGAAARLAEDIANDFASKAKAKELSPDQQVKLYEQMKEATGRVNLPANLRPVHLAAKQAGKINADDYAEWISKQNLSPANKQILIRYNDSESMALGMLRAAERNLINRGIQPVYWNGQRIHLSEVLADTPRAQRDTVLAAFRDKGTQTVPVVEEAINKAAGRRALTVSDFLADAARFTTEAKKSVEEAYSAPVAARILDTLPKTSQQILKDAGLTKEETAAVTDLMRNIVNVDKLAPEKIFESIPEELMKAVQEGRISGQAAGKINRAIIKTLQSSHDELATSVTGNKAIDGFMLRTSTIFGRQAEMKRFSQDAFLYAEMNAGARATWLRNMVKDHTQEEIITAFKLAQEPALRTAGASPKVLALADKMDDYFSRMLSSTGFEDMVDLAGTPVARSMMGMMDVNKHLKALGSKFEFINSKNAKNLRGAPRDYSENGVGWMKSWELADPKKSGQDPVSFLYDLDVAIQRTVAEYSLYDEFAMRFGAREGDHWFDANIHKTSISHPRLAGVKFDPSVAMEFKRLMRDNEMGNWRPNSKPVQFYSKGLRVWKTSVTIYFPSHHVRNLVGDLWLMWGAGHNDPRSFIKAIRVLHSQKSKYMSALKDPTLDALSGVIDKDAIRWASTKTSDVILKKKGVTLTAEDVYHAAFERGLLLNANRAEDIFGETPLGNLVNSTPENAVIQRLAQPFGGRVHHAAASIAEHREHFVRLSHFIASVNKQMRKAKGNLNMQDIFDNAAHEVRKWHPDGTDLTRFEQKLRYVIPFYSWTRKSVPLMLQVLAQRPAKVLYYPRAQQALAGITGTQNQGETNLLDPFPNSQLFPDWIRASGIGPLGDPESDNPASKFFGNLGAYELGPFGDKQGLTIVNPSNPFQDNTSQLLGMGGAKDILSGISNTLTPGAKIPIDVFSNTTFSGAPISQDEGGEGYVSYIADQIPQLGALQRISGIGRNDRPEEKNTNQQNIINILTALGIRGTGPYRTSAEFEARDRARNAN